MESRNTVLLNPFAQQQYRHRHREQTYGQSEGVGREGGGMKRVTWKHIRYHM